MYIVGLFHYLTDFYTVTSFASIGYFFADALYKFSFYLPTYLFTYKQGCIL